MISPPKHSPFESARSFTLSHVCSRIRRASSGAIFVMVALLHYNHKLALKQSMYDEREPHGTLVEVNAIERHRRLND